MRQTLATANAGDLINFAVNGTINLTSGPLIISKEMRIDGPGANRLTISGNNNGRVLKLTARQGKMSINNLTIADGNAGSGSGGGIYQPGPGLVLYFNNCIVRNNVANGGGGGISAARAVVSSCTFSDNVSSLGGAILVNVWCDLSASTISNNRASEGAGIYKTGSGTLRIFNSTVSANEAKTAAGGIGNQGGEVWLDNVIVARNRAPIAPDFRGAITSRGYNLLGETDGSSGLTAGVNHDLAGTSAQPLDPKLGPLADNGGRAPTMALLAGSPALDAGNATAGVDQRRLPRPADFAGIANADGGNGSDIGAFELQLEPPSFVVNSTGDTDDGACDPLGQGTGNQDCTLREAIAAANLIGTGAVVTFDRTVFSPSSPQTITLASTLPVIITPTSIVGPGASQLTVSGAGRVRVFQVNASRSASIAELTIANGNALNAGTGEGGGILNEGNGLLTVSRCVLADNLATTGGGIYSAAGELTVTDSTIETNSASDGGGVYIAAYARAAISLTLFRDNFATGGRGGAIATSSGATATILKCLVEKNAGDLGGGVANSGGTMMLIDSTFAGNSAAQSGGAVYQDAVPAFSSAGLSVTRCTLHGNSAADGGGIYSGYVSLDLSDSTLSGNAASNFGGGVFQQSGTASVLNSTVTENTAAKGGGLYSAGLAMRVGNSIVASNTASSSVSNPGRDLFGSFVTQGYNLIGVRDGAAYGIANDGSFDQVGSIAAPINPALGPLQDNGGPTTTHALLAGSRAIDRGNPAVVAPDQRGYLRTAGTDIGAFEFNGSAPPPQLVGAVSRKIHCSAGAFDLALPQSGPAGIECRSGGTGGSHQLVVTFSSPVSVSAVSVASIDNSATAAASVSGIVATIDLAGVANAQWLVVTLHDVSTGGAALDFAIPLGVLRGDANRDGSVSASDVSLTKAAAGQTVTALNYFCDVNVSGGAINSSDVGMVKAQSGTELPQ